MADVGLIRKRLRAIIEVARRDEISRRSRAHDAQEAYRVFLEGHAVPAFRAVATVLKAEGLPWEVMTPSGGVRLVSERRRDDAIELELDASADPPQPLVTITRTRGSRILRTDRPVQTQANINELTEDDVVELLLDEIKPWLA